MAGFPSLKPAFTILVDIGGPMSMGSSSRGTPLAVVPMVGGSMRSEPDFSPALDAEFVGVGNDYIHNDPTGKHMRLNANATLKTSDGSFIFLNYTGVVDITPGVAAILGGSPDAKTTDFGNSFTTVTFETGDEKYKELETGVYVAAGRFKVEKNKPVAVEYRVSRLVKG